MMALKHFQHTDGDGNKLIIQGNDTQRNIGIEGSESLTEFSMIK